MSKDIRQTNKNILMPSREKWQNPEISELTDCIRSAVQSKSGTFTLFNMSMFVYDMLAATLIHIV